MAPGQIPSPASVSILVECQPAEPPVVQAPERERYRDQPTGHRRARPLLKPSCWSWPHRAPFRGTAGGGRIRGHGPAPPAGSRDARLPRRHRPACATGHAGQRRGRRRHRIGGGRRGRSGGLVRLRPAHAVDRRAPHQPLRPAVVGGRRHPGAGVCHRGHRRLVAGTRRRPVCRSWPPSPGDRPAPNRLIGSRRQAACCSGPGSSCSPSPISAGRGSSSPAPSPPCSGCSCSLPSPYEPSPGRRPAGPSPSGWPGGIWPDTRADRERPSAPSPWPWPSRPPSPSARPRPRLLPPRRICPPTSSCCTSAPAAPSPGNPIPVVSGAEQQALQARVDQLASSLHARSVLPLEAAYDPTAPRRDRLRRDRGRSRRARSPHRSPA